MIDMRIDPILFRWGDMAIGWHGLWLAAGMFVAYQVFIHHGQRRGIDPDHLVRLLLWATLAGYVGARLLYVLEHWETYAARPARILAMHQGGVRLYGGLIGAAIAMVVYARLKRLPFWALADAMAMAVPVGEIIGRVGCTLNGDSWGLPTNGAWGLVYWHPNAAIPPYLRGIPTYPIPTMLQAWNAGLLVLLLVSRKRLHRPGTLFVTWMIAHALGRLVVDTWRPGELLLCRLKGTQVISLIAIGLALLLALYLRAPRAPAPHAAGQPEPATGNGAPADKGVDQVSFQ